MVKMATRPDFGFLYIVFGLKIRFFNSYKSEFKINNLDEDDNAEEDQDQDAIASIAKRKTERPTI